ncbi:alkaline phosphatase family protein [Arsenicicoccus piscis]|uniref:alkaline phosphatase family protein n=1 Tax=Arsenicicoccus piscis TaxID=673954 RepID=UPI001F4C8FA4|nr:alkaline phosphatase family protein [Arsenicicoccus piscis]
MSATPGPLLGPAAAYDGLGLANVLSSVVRSLGVDLGPADVDPLQLPPAQRAVVVLVDGLGDELLRARSGHAPFLRRALGTPGAALRLQCGFPSTTATSMGTFGTGLPPGAHGLVGYQVLIPGEERLLNELSWDAGVDPYAWQPSETLFQRAAAAGVAVTRIGPHFFDGSGLTEAALRGGSFQGARDLDARVDRAVAAVRSARRSLVYLYWGDVDKAGHVFGCESPEWTTELERVDAELARLARLVPADTAIYVTADHGMVDVDHLHRINLEHDAELDAGVRLMGGEPRAPQLYVRPGATADVLATWRERIGDRGVVVAREQALDEGWFGRGAPRPAVVDRIGDVLVALTGELAIIDSRTMRPELMALLGLHGSITEAETAIPLLTFAPRDHERP